jgi:hypothetical protein
MAVKHIRITIWLIIYVSQRLFITLVLHRHVSRVYCIFAKLTNSNVLGKLSIRDSNNSEIGNCYWWIWQKYNTRGVGSFEKLEGGGRLWGALFEKKGHLKIIFGDLLPSPGSVPACSLKPKGSRDCTASNESSKYIGSENSSPKRDASYGFVLTAQTKTIKRNWNWRLIALGLYRLCSATCEQLLEFWATFCLSSNLEQPLLSGAIFYHF